MKKIIICGIIVSLVVSFAGCRKSDNPSMDISDDNSNASSQYTSSVSSEVAISSEEESGESVTTTTQSGQTSSTTSKVTSSPANSTSSTLGHGQEDIPPVPESINWTSLAGKWEFYTDNKERNSDSRYFVLDFSIDEEGHTDISSGGFVLPEDVPNLSYDITTNNKWIFNSNTYYLFWGWDGYYGNFFITQGSEDLPVLEMRCYDGSGNFFLTDELKFKRLDNNTLQYIGDDYEPLKLRSGDILKR